MPDRLPLPYLAKCRSDVWLNYSVLRHGAFDGFLVTSKNSGTHWMSYMLAVALADTYSVPRPLYFSEKALRPYIRLPKDKPVHPGLPRLARSHTIPHRMVDWAWLRERASLPPYVLGVRHPMSILASHYAKWSHEIQVSWADYLRGDPSGQRYRCDIYWIARFWNRWGDVQAAWPDSILRLQYEQTRAEPRAALEAMASHWNIALKPEAIEAALHEGSKEAMARRVDPDGEANVLQNRAETVEELFSGEAMDIYASQAERLFRHNLGYDLMACPALPSHSSALRAHS